MEHVAHVESVSYRIAKSLGLNTELTKAIAMDHDLGYAPFGHEGEYVIINELVNDLIENSSLEKGISFSYEKQNFINTIKQFNYEKIYNNKQFNYYKKYAQLVINSIFEELSNYYDGENTIENLEKNINKRYKFLISDFKGWIIKYCDESIINTKDLKTSLSNKKIYNKLEDEQIYKKAIIDFISGMTDSYAIKYFNDLISLLNKKRDTSLSISLY